jgi:hypothetical protein
MQRLQQAEASASATMMLPRTTVPPRERVEAGGRLSTAPTAAMAAGARQPCGGRGDLRRAFSFIVNTDLTNAAAQERRAPSPPSLCMECFGLISWAQNAVWSGSAH